jgi:Tfp pilus assembly protein PilO
LSARERLLIALVVAGAIAAAFYVLIYSRAMEEQNVLRADLDKKGMELQRLQGLAQTKEAKEQDYAALQERIRLIEVRLPPEREIPRLIRQLQDVAQELKVKLTLLRPGPTQAPAQAGVAAAQPAGQRTPAPAGGQTPKPAVVYQEFRIDLGFDGTYADLMAYLGRLENFPRFLVLTQLSLAPGELPRLKVTIAGKTFVLPRERQGAFQ